MARWRRIGLTLFGALLLADAIALMAMGLFNFGIVLPACIGAAFLVLAWRWSSMAPWRASNHRRQWLWRAGWTAFALWLVTVAVFFYGIGRVAGTTPPAGLPVHAIIVLGSGTPNCSASPTLIARLDQGLLQAQRWPHAAVVVDISVQDGLDLVAQRDQSTTLFGEDQSLESPDVVWMNGEQTHVLVHAFIHRAVELGELGEVAANLLLSKMAGSQLYRAYPKPSMSSPARAARNQIFTSI